MWFNRTGELQDGIYVEIHKPEFLPMTQLWKKGDFVVNAQGEHGEPPVEVYQDGLLAHVVGILRAQVSVPHEDVEGEQGGGSRRSMGRNLKVVTGK
eukprot:3503101-Prorocentrum_lima.AAC.1